ncbi:MAG: T9SS type A sorting domain-containing protein, partial [Bacteroidales bacterium]|nr:T9SS type A sorting domain-containing protein [Bacteroidales bacterium]
FRIVPNPAGNYAQILFSSTSQEAITIRIYSVTGNLIREWTLHPASGSNSIQWDLTDQNKRKVKQGMYFCSLFSGTEHKTARISVAP